MKKNNKFHKLSVQLIGMTVILFIIGTIIGGFLLYTGSRDMFLQAKEEMIAEKLDSVTKDVKRLVCTDWLFDYMVSHDDYFKALTPEENDRISELLPDLFSYEIDMTALKKSLDSFEPKDQTIMARAEYKLLGNVLNSRFQAASYEKLYIIDISPENRGFLYCDSKKFNSLEDDDALFLNTDTGVRWDYREEDHPALKQLAEQKEPEIIFEIAPINSSKATSYIGYMPINGGKAAICISYNWEPLRSQLFTKVRNLALILLGAMIVTCLLIIIFMRRIVIRPLGTVQEAIRGYMDEKDSSLVKEKLSSGKRNDELGMLSNDVEELTVELDSYISNIKKLTKEVMESLAQTIDAKDKYTNGHSFRVALYSKMLAKELGLSKQEQEDIYYMGLLHDIGKIGIPNAIINKTTKLTDEEYETIKKHPIYGYEILSEIESMPELSVGARYHHERIDGKGYPDGLKGDEIPYMARIIAVADSYDTMTSNRSYRKYLPQDVVRAEIEKNIGTQFDEGPARAMLRVIDSDKSYMLHE